MLTLEGFRTIFLLTSILGALAISSPALVFILPPQAGERFSVLYVLGPNRMAEDYPFNVKVNESHDILLGISNHMGSLTYYILYVKLRNNSEPLPNSTVGTPSPLQSFSEFQAFLSDAEVWEKPINFSFSSISILGNTCLVDSININGLAFHVNKTASWDPENKGFFLQLFFELWIYIPENRGFSYHNRFVSIWLNMTI